MYRRSLLQSEQPLRRDVNNATQLYQAIEDGVRQINIVDHLDLRDIKDVKTPDQGNTTLPDISEIDAMWGTCAFPTNQTIQGWNLTAPELLQLKPAQCIVVCDTDCLRVRRTPFWLHNIYLRFRRTERSDKPSAVLEDTSNERPDMVTILEAGNLWMTDVTLQGDGQPGRSDATRGIHVKDFNSKVYAENCVYASLGGRLTSVMQISIGTAHFRNSTFQQLKPRGRKTGAITLDDRAELAVDQCIFDPNNGGSYVIGLYKSTKWYTSDTTLYSQPLAKTDSEFLDSDSDYDEFDPKRLEDMPGGTFISDTSDFYRETRNAILGDLGVGGVGGSDGLSGAAVGGIIAAAVALLLLFLAALFMFVRRRRQQRERADATKDLDLGLMDHDSDSLDGGLKRPARPASPGRGKNPFSSAACLAYDANGMPLPAATGATVNSALGTQDGGATVARTPPSPDSSLQERMGFVHWQLDQFTGSQLLLGKYKSLGPAARRQGGQAVVQFCRSVHDTREYAIKVFAVPTAYAAEAAMYKDDTISNFLPRVEAMHDGNDPDITDPAGTPLSPCIVMEKGESLNEWSERAEPDLFMSIAVVANVALRLIEFHAAGFCHRDLKPANVMWLPRENRWTVIDFGCAAKNGEQAPLSFTLVYAAPEVVTAVRAKQKHIRADPALDAWALGVMAFELLTSEPAFHVLSDGKDEVMAQLAGEKRLPWEDGTDEAADRLEKLGVFKGAVMQLLNRDPQQRPSMQRFYDACNRVFSSRTTIKI